MDGVGAMQMAHAQEMVAQNQKARAERAARHQAILAEILATHGHVTVASRKYNGAAATLRAR